MKFSKLIKNKKGVVLETAVIFMVLIFTFCLVLSTATLIGYNRVRIENIRLDNDRDAELIFEELVELIVYDYLDYIGSVEVTLPPLPPITTDSVTTISPETQLSPESSGGTAQDTTKPNNEETIAPPAEPDNREAVNVPVDIMPEIHLLSPLPSTEEITDATTEAQSGTTLPIPEETTSTNFNDYLAENEVPQYYGLIFESEEFFWDDNDENTQIKIFSLKVYNESGACFLDMLVMKSVFRFGDDTSKNTTIQYINKYPQNNYQPEGN